MAAMPERPQTMDEACGGRRTMDDRRWGMESVSLSHRPSSIVHRPQACIPRKEGKQMLAQLQRPVVRREYPVIFVALVLIFGSLLPLSGGNSARPGLRPALPGKAALGRLPVGFEPNVGQADPQVRYVAHTAAGTLLFAPSGVVLEVPQMGGPDSGLGVGPSRGKEQGGKEANPSLVSLRFLGANGSVSMRSGQMLPGKVNYFLGKDQANWHSNLPTFEGITYSQIYGGIDLEYSGSSGHLKGTYALSPGADPGQIRWRYEGVEKVSLDAEGNLLIEVPSGPVGDS